VNILGITQTNHGSSAAIYDGRRLVAANEERFDRIKFSPVFPNYSINWCLSSMDLDFEDLDAVGFYMTSSNFLQSARRSQTERWRFYPEVLYSVLCDLFRRAKSMQNGVKYIHERVVPFKGKPLDLFFVDHHLAHAAGNFLVSPFERAAILCLDGTGDGYSMSFGHGKGTEMEFIYRQPFPHSLGMFYSTFTQFFGFGANSDEYKVMGLAAYGDPEPYYERVKSLIRLTDAGSFELNMRYFSFHMITEPLRYNRYFIEQVGLEPNRETETVDQGYCDLAAAAQKVTEETLLHVLRGLKQMTGEENLCYGGGVALNCLANGKIIPESGFKGVFIPPNPGDGGLAIATPAYLLHTLNGEKRGYVYEHDYLGPAYSVDEIRRQLDENGIRYQEPNDLAGEVARRLAQRKVIGHFAGAQEFGPRALGNRSILADPRPAESRDVVNRKIKFREPFRPFAPSCLKESAPEVFVLREQALDQAAPEEFMLTTAVVRPHWQDRLQAVTHKDGTARLQTVDRHHNAKYHEIIKAFERETGVPAVLNTSFNVKGEPIVLTPQDALRCFYSTGMDALVLGPFLIEK
jgi:carbamoyltransferase